MLIHELWKIISLITSFLSLLVWALYLIILSVEWYNCIWSHSTTHTHTHTHSVGLLWMWDWPISEIFIWQHTTLTREKHPCPQQDQTCDLSKWTPADPCLSPRGHWDRWLIIMCVYVIPVRSSNKSSSVISSVLLQQLSSSSCDSAGQHHRGLHHCSTGSDSPPNSLLVTDPTECSKRSTSPDSSSTSSANSHLAGRPVTQLQLTQ